MNFLDSFTRTNGDGFIQYELKEVDKASLLSSIPEKIQECYITKRDLKSLCKKLDTNASDFLAKYKLPDDGKIMSGDFGEIFCLLIVKNKLKMKGVHVFGIPKWRWKQQRNKPAPHSDAILFHFENSKIPCENDFIVSIESKMKATPSKTYRPIQNALDGAKDDKLGRLAKTLIWMDEKFAIEGRPHLLKKLDRFRKPDKFGTYKKHYKAIAIIDSDLFKDEIDAGWESSEKDIQVIVFSIKDLKGTYTKTFENVLA